MVEVGTQQRHNEIVISGLITVLIHLSKAVLLRALFLESLQDCHLSDYLRLFNSDWLLYRPRDYDLDGSDQLLLIFDH